MNKYPMWKYAIIAIALVVSLIYAAPNLFGEVPAVQISGVRAANKVDATMKAAAEDALRAANLQPTSSELEDGSLRFRFADTDSQLKARDVLQAKAGPAFVVALNLVSASPHWL